MKKIESSIGAVMQSAIETKEMAKDFQKRLFQVIVKDFSLEVNSDKKVMRDRLEAKGIQLHYSEEIRPDIKRFELFVYATLNNEFYKGYRILTEQRKDGLYIGDFEMTELPSLHGVEADEVETTTGHIVGDVEQVSDQISEKFKEAVELAKDETVKGAMKHFGINEDNPLDHIKFISKVANDEVQFFTEMKLEEATTTGEYKAYTSAVVNGETVAGNKVVMKVTKEQVEVNVYTLEVEAV